MSLSAGEAFHRHAKRAWPMRGKEVGKRREAMLRAVRRDFVELSFDSITKGSYREVRQELTLWLKIIRSNTRHDMRVQTTSVCLELLTEWLPDCPGIQSSLVDWANQMAEDEFAGIGQVFAKGILNLVKEHQASIPKQKLLFS